MMNQGKSQDTLKLKIEKFILLIALNLIILLHTF